MEAATLWGLQRVFMALTDDPKVVLESSDIIFSLVNDPNWYLKNDEISPTLVCSGSEITWRKRQSGSLLRIATHFSFVLKDLTRKHVFKSFREIFRLEPHFWSLKISSIRATFQTIQVWFWTQHFGKVVTRKMAKQL